MQNLSAKTVREIALEMPITTKVFEEFKIDYCCGGRKPLLEACQNVGANPELVMQKIEDVIGSNEYKGFEWLAESTLTELIAYILETHHTFTRDEIFNLTPLMAKVSDRHGENHQELLELEKVFYELCDDLGPHLYKEEQVLFPYIEKLERAKTNSTSVPFSCFGTVNNPIRMMMMEHDTAGDLLRKMREITNDYILPEGACMSYTALFTRLEAFEKDLHQHIHLENNLLFPKAIELEEKVLS
jgi:regulator of cell morphogenesis and NO signaling